MLFTLVTVGFLTQSFALVNEDHVTPLSFELSTKLRELDATYQDLFCDLVLLSSTDEELLMTIATGDNVYYNLRQLEAENYIDIKKKFLLLDTKLQDLVATGIERAVISKQIVQTTTFLLKEHHLDDLTPCYDRWENAISIASAAFATCVIGAAPTGIGGLAVCSVMYGASVMAADKLYEDCMAGKYSNKAKY